MDPKYRVPIVEILVVKIEMVPLLLSSFNMQLRILAACLSRIQTSVVDEAASLVQSPRLKTISSLLCQTGSQNVTVGYLEFRQQPEKCRLTILAKLIIAL